MMMPDELLGLLRDHGHGWCDYAFSCEGDGEGFDGDEGDAWVPVSLGSFVVFPFVCGEDGEEPQDGDWRPVCGRELCSDAPKIQDDAGTCFGRGADTEDTTEKSLEDYDVHNPHELGIVGERLAALYLQRRGWTVLESNYRTEHGEADIVCKDGGSVVLVEVKTRYGTDTFPEEAVDAEKIKRYRKITLSYLAKHEWVPDVRLDVVAVNVTGDNEAHVHHFMRVCAWES